MVEFEREGYDLRVDADWHRGMICLPKGEIFLQYYHIDKMVKLQKSKSTAIAWDAFENMLENRLKTDYTLRFFSSYTEFLYPGSNGMGFCLEMPYSGSLRYSWQDFKDDYLSHYSYDMVRTAYRKYEKICEAYDNLMSEIEDYIKEIKTEWEDELLEDPEIN